ncbi:MAG: IPTL-CTERM sorting domain-containing protein [bacterium]|nr:IPTL-CTERM sorting domain-containing protein [bacterium]
MARFVTVLAIGLVMSKAHGQVGEAWVSPEGAADGGTRAAGDGVVEAVGGAEEDVFYDSVDTSDGGVVAVGYTTSFGAGGRDVLLVKFGAWGDIVWKATLGDVSDEVGRGVIETQDGGLVLTGYKNSADGTRRGLLLSKFQSNGAHEWSYVLSRLDGDLDFDGHAVIEDPNGDLVVTGEMERHIAPLRHTLLYARFDSGGSLIHKRSIYNSVYGSWDHYGYSLAGASDGRHLLVGKVDYGADEDVFVVMMRSNATVEWGYTIGNDTIDEEARSIIEASDQGYALTGTVGDDSFLYKLQPNLDIDWAKRTVGSDSEGYSVIETEGGFVVTGSITDTSTDVLLTRWDQPAGSLAWSRSIGGAGFDTGRSVLATASGRLWVAGWTTSWGAGDSDGLLAMFESDGTTCLADGGGVGSVTWEPEENPVYAMAAWNPLETQSVEWTNPTIGDPTLTRTVVCDEGPLGACCLGDGSCVERTETGCDTLSGVYRGVGTICYEPQACCSNGTCLDADPWCCQALGGDAKPVDECQGDGNVNGTDDACEPPPNDLCVDAAVITALPYSESLWYRLATGDADVSCNSSSCAWSPYGVWWYYQPAEDCVASISVSGDHTAAAIFTGSDCDHLTEVYCSDSGSVSYSMTGGVGHWIMVSSYSYGCSVVKWPPEPVSIDFGFDALGACCQADGSCLVATEDVCTTGAGDYQGDGTTCDPTGACCLLDGSCLETSAACCALTGGSYGEGTSCLGERACCSSNGDCVMADALCCEEELGGTPLGSGSVCRGQRSCCLDDGTTCIDGVDRSCCIAMGGRPGHEYYCLGDSNTNGIDDACEPDGGSAIPTTSEWGLIVMTLLLLTAGTLVIGRRRSSVATP